MTTLKDTIRDIARNWAYGDRPIDKQLHEAVESACYAAIRAFAEREPSEAEYREFSRPEVFDVRFQRMMQQALKELE